MEYLKTLTPDALRARYSQLTPVIKILADAWRDQNLSVSIAVGTTIGDTRHEIRLTDILETCCDDTVRQFIHDLCTHLCAEKQQIEGLLFERNEPIFTTR